ncbi:MAG TPA: diacylglycerol kinase family protein [Anaerolineaceae bacterium]|nr:diacylglycerol kinase family protein [Anaerolineaceae bacterium]
MNYAIRMGEHAQLMTKAIQHISIIYNPDAGQPQALLKNFNRIFHKAGVRWDIHITNENGDGERLAKQAIAAGTDVVAVYGGDGTLMDVANGMVGSSVPMAIIPGGTGNVISVELGIPRDPAAACALIVNPQHVLRPIDVGRVENHCFLLRVGFGLEANIVQGAGREMKDRFGIFAYLMSILAAISQPSPSHYFLNLDGMEYECDGLACMVANAASLGVSGLDLADNISIDDGLLDVFIIRKIDLEELFSMAARVLGSPDTPNSLLHWQVSKLMIRSDPPQQIEADGDLIGEAQASIEVLPLALNVIVPPGNLTLKG